MILGFVIKIWKYMGISMFNLLTINRKYIGNYFHKVLINSELKKSRCQFCNNLKNFSLGLPGEFIYLIKKNC